MKANQRRDTFVLCPRPPLLQNKLDRFSCLLCVCLIFSQWNLFGIFCIFFILFWFLSKKELRFIMRTICSGLAAAGFRLNTKFSHTLWFIYLFHVELFRCSPSELCMSAWAFHTLGRCECVCVYLIYFDAYRHRHRHRHIVWKNQYPKSDKWIKNKQRIFSWYFCQHFNFHDAFVVVFRFCAVFSSVTFGNFFMCFLVCRHIFSERCLLFVLACYRTSCFWRSFQGDVRRCTNEKWKGRIER